MRTVPRDSQEMPTFLANRILSTTIGALLALTSALAAQNGNVLSVLNAEEATKTIVHPNSNGHPWNLGVAAFVNAAGSLEYHVSSVGRTDPVDGRWLGANAPPNTIFVLSEDGAFVRKYDQPIPPWPPGATISGAYGWGFRDGANDQKFTGPADPDSTTFFWGNEAGIWLVDQNARLKDTYAAEAGVLSAPAVPIEGPGLAIVENYRGVAYNPKGNPRGVPRALGRGSWFTGSYGSELLEIDNAGNVLNLFPNITDWYIYGLAWDPNAETLWLNDSGDFIVQVDPVTGLETGRRIWSGPAQTLDRGHAGGLDIVLDDRTSCRTILGFGRRNGGTSLVAMRQDSALVPSRRHWDTLVTYLVDFDSDSTPDSPATLTHTEHGRLEVGVDGSVSGDLATIGEDTISAEIRLSDPSGNDAAGALHLVVDDNARGGASLPPLLPGLDHIVCGWSLPAASLQTTPGGADVSVPIVPGVGISIPTRVIPLTIEVIAAQALVVNRKLFGNPGVLPSYASNRVKFDPVCTSTGLPASIGVSVSAAGSDSFNQDTSTGFWQITNDSAYPILSAELALLPDFANGWFDTDEQNMGWPGPGGLASPTYDNRFSAGDIPFPNNLGADGKSIKTPGCAGTWRNRSHVVTGVNFGRPGELPAEHCAQVHGAAGTGFTAGVSEPWRVGYSMTALNLAFVPGRFLGGVTAEWDCDTDGRGVSGAAHAGMSVDITFAGILPNGADGTWCAVLEADPHDPTRASASR